MTFINYFKIAAVHFIIVIAVSISGCKKKSDEEKQLSADFATNKSEYIAGETVQLTNKSTDGKTYRWTMPDGQTSKSKDASFMINETMSSGSLSFKLEVFSESGNKSDYSVKTIPVKAAEGQLVVYPQNQAYYSYYTISIDGGAGEKKYFPYGAVEPVCGQSWYPSYTLKIGVHAVVVSYLYNNPLPWTSTVEVKANTCTKLGFPNH